MSQRVLIVKTTSMGDVVHALPAIADLARVKPDTQIDWVIERSFADIPRLSEHVRFVHEVAVRDWRRRLLTRSTWDEINRVRHAFRIEQYDAVVDLQGLVKSAVIGKLAGAPLYGYDKDSIRESVASRFYSQTFSVSKSLSAVKRCRTLLAHALGYSIDGLPLDFGLRAISTKTQDEKPYVVFLVNTSRQTKLWSEERWVQLARYCAKQGYEVRFFWASPEEEKRVKRIAKTAGDFCRVCPRLSIGACAQMMQGAAFVVGVDTGLTHLAAATARPTVGLFLDYPIELVGLTGTRVKSLGGVGANPEVAEVCDAIAETSAKS